MLRVATERDSAESGQSRPRDDWGPDVSVEHIVDRQRWARALAAASYLFSAVLIAWGVASGETALILIGLVLLAILLLTTNG